MAKKDPKHLFLRVYQKNFGGYEKPLSEHIKDYNKERPIKYYKYNDTSQAIQSKHRRVRNLDHLFIWKEALINTIFVVKYLTYLQQNGLYEDIEIQDIYEMSLLMDSDQRPKTEVFKYAYISDSKRNEIHIYSKYYMLRLWIYLGISDLEFYRRIMETLVNAVPNNKGVFTLSDNYSFDSDMIKYNSDSSDADISVSVGIKSKRQRDCNVKLRELESQFLKDLKTPTENVFFDGDRITVLIKNSPVSLMFGLRKTTKGSHKHVYEIKPPTTDYNTVNKIEVSHPCELQPAFIDREKSERCNSWWSGRSSWDFTWEEYITKSADLLENGGDEDVKKESINKLREISYVLRLKNDGLIQYNDGRPSKKVSEIINDYLDKRQSIKDDYDDIKYSMSKISTQLLTSLRYKKEIMVCYKTDNGYVVSFYKPYIRSISKKVDSRAEFYDKNFKLIGVSSFYTDYFLTTSEINGLSLTSSSVNFKRNEIRKELYKKTFENIFENSNPISVDYYDPKKNSGVGNYLRNLEKLTDGNDGTQTLNITSYPLNMYNNKMEQLYVANNIDGYISKMHESMEVNGYANIRGYKKVVKYLNENSFYPVYMDIDDYELNPDYGVLESHRVPRKKLLFKVRGGKLIDTEKFTSFKTHIGFKDVEYVDVAVYRTKSTEYELTHMKMSDPIPNFRREIAEIRKKQRHKTR